MAVRPLVLRSIEDATGQRCVDLCEEHGRFGWIECRRDPEDSHGWRSLHGGVVVPKYSTLDAAIEAACAEVPWLREAMS